MFSWVSPQSLFTWQWIIVSYHYINMIKDWLGATAVLESMMFKIFDNQRGLEGSKTYTKEIEKEYLIGVKKHK